MVSPSADVHELTKIDPWFLQQMVELIDAEREYAALAEVAEDDMRRMKRLGFSDRQLGALRGEDERSARERRWALNVRPSYKMVDTCAGEFPSSTPYLYGCYDEESEAPRSGKRSVVILGSGPNRIGQGVEFDYCCVRAVLALRERGFETIMINSNPETVSTDFDTSDKLYFEPLTFEDVLEIVQREQPEGVIVQLGGQTPLKLTRQLEAAGVRILGTSPDSIDIAGGSSPVRQDRARARARAAAERHGDELRRGARDRASASAIRCSCVRRTCSAAAPCRSCTTTRRSSGISRRRCACRRSGPCSSTGSWKTRSSATSTRSATAHASSSAASCSTSRTPAFTPATRRACCRRISIGEADMQSMREQTVALATALGVVGLINVQYAIKNGVVYVLEVNPRASRTIPFVSKAIGVPLASLAARVMLGETLDDIGFTEEIIPPYVSVKEAVFPFNKFPGTDPVLGPEMRSTGECMGISDSFGSAFAKAQLAASNGLPLEGSVLITVVDSDKPTVTPIARRFHEMGFKIMATRGNRGRTCARAAFRRSASSRCTPGDRTVST